MITIEVTLDEIWALASVVQDRYNDNMVEICKEKRLLRSFFLKRRMPYPERMRQVFYRHTAGLAPRGR